MARRNRNKSTQGSGEHHTSTPPALNLQDAGGISFQESLAQARGFDSFQNQLARTGYATTNLMEGTSYVLTRLTQAYNLLNALYRNSWLVRRIIDTIPKDMMKNGWRYECELTPDEVNQLQRMERTTRLKRDLLRGLNMGRLYGGAAGLIMLDGQEENMEDPLDLDSIMPGDFKGLLITDRWAGIYPQQEIVTDINSPEFGLPEYYEFSDWAKKEKYRVHHTRIIRFVGDDLPEWERLAESYWGASKIESVFEELKKRDNTSANIALLIFQARLKVLQMEGMDQIVTGNATNQKNVIQTVQAQNALMNNFGIMLMGNEDDFKSIDYSYAGLNEIYQSFMLDLSGATQIPVTKLFGRSAAGLNSTGEGDLTNYYDVVENEQEAHLLPILEKLAPVICMSTLGYVPEDIDFSFNPVETPSEKDMAESIKWRVEAVLAAHNNGLISDQVAVKELKQMSEGTGLFTNITDEDVNKANDEPMGSEPILGNPMGEDINENEELDK